MTREASRPLVTTGCLGASWSSSDHLEYLGIPELPGETGASQGPSGVLGDHLGPSETN